MGKEQIIDYVMNSPANTNRAVLEGMLDEIGGGGTSEPLIVIPHFNTEDNGEYLNKTWQELWDAYISGKQVLLVHDTSDEIGSNIYARELEAVENENGYYYIYFYNQTFGCQQSNDYPFYSYA